MQNSTDTWTVHGRPGYLGSRRDVMTKLWNDAYGHGGWKLAWKVHATFVDWPDAVMLYEEAYFRFLLSQPETVDWLCRDACDVYDDEASNVHSGLDYKRQETRRTHLQDIAIRRCIDRLGRRFEGTQLLQIRHYLGQHALSLMLSPGTVPFHEPDLIERPELAGWWNNGSIESFYQSNKFLLVRQANSAR